MPDKKDPGSLSTHENTIARAKIKEFHRKWENTIHGIKNKGLIHPHQIDQYTQERNQLSIPSDLHPSDVPPEVSAESRARSALTYGSSTQYNPGKKRVDVSAPAAPKENVIDYSKINRPGNQGDRPARTLRYDNKGNITEIDHTKPELKRSRDLIKAYKESKKWKVAGEVPDSPELEKGEKPFHGYNKERHARTGGLNDKAREKMNREEGSNLKRPVTEKNPTGKKAARKKSFCARMSGVQGPTSKDGKLTPKGAALKRWRCSKSLQERFTKSQESLAKRCWEGYEPVPGKKPYSDDSCRPIKKNEEHPHDDGPRMAMKFLADMQENIDKLLATLGEGDLPDWVDAKIAQAAQHMQEVSSYTKFDQENPEDTELEKSPLRAALEKASSCMENLKKRYDLLKTKQQDKPAQRTRLREVRHGENTGVHEGESFLDQGQSWAGAHTARANKMQRDGLKNAEEVQSYKDKRLAAKLEHQYKADELKTAKPLPLPKSLKEDPEVLSKPPRSEAQRRFMGAVAAGKVKDVPASVGREFLEEDKGKKLPEKLGKELGRAAAEDAKRGFKEKRFKEFKRQQAERMAQQKPAKVNPQVPEKIEKGNLEAPKIGKNPLPQDLSPEHKRRIGKEYQEMYRKAKAGGDHESAKEYAERAKKLLGESRGQ
jgi:hypothetical protein